MATHPLVAPSQRTRLSLQFLQAIMDRFRFGFALELAADPLLPVVPLPDAGGTELLSDGECDPTGPFILVFPLTALLAAVPISISS